MEVCSPYFDPEYENLNEEIYGTRVSVDNDSCEKCTVVKVVDSINKHGLLLQVVQVLTDMELFITKSYISSDAGWFMDVFHVKDHLGDKVTDGKVISHMQQAISEKKDFRILEEVKRSSKNVTGVKSSNECTALEMIGVNRPGLFSEISAVLAQQRCNVVEAHAWSYNTHLACVAYISDESTSTCIEDPNRLSTIEGHLSNILGNSTIDGDDDTTSTVRTCGKMSHPERRLHQLMLANQDLEGPQDPLNTSTLSINMNNHEEGKKTVVSVDQWQEKGYTMVNIECLDRPKLMFDAVCTLTDMQYVIFHANIASHGPFAHQEYFVRNKDGSLLDSEVEVQRVAKCLEAAIDCRVCDGICLEIDLQNKVDVLSYVTRTLREHGLTVTRANIATHGEKTKSVLYIQDISGNEVDARVVESVTKKMEPLAYQVKNETVPPTTDNLETGSDDDQLSFGSLLRTRLERFSHSFIST